MGGRWLLYLAVAVILAAVSPFLASFVAVSGSGDAGPLQLWFFGIPEAVESWLRPGRGGRLVTWMAVYAVQYFVVIALVGSVLAHLRRPKGIERVKAFEEAVTQFHGQP